MKDRKRMMMKAMAVAYRCKPKKHLVKWMLAKVNMVETLKWMVNLGEEM